jgi:hypothetical protein
MAAFAKSWRFAPTHRDADFDRPPAQGVRHFPTTCPALP